MQKLFENWRKYVTEADTDNDGIDDEKELAIIDKGEIEPDEGALPDLKHIKIIDATDPLYKDDWGLHGHLQGVWTTSLDNLMAMEEENWWPDPDHVDQLEGSQVPDGVGPPRWRQSWEYEDEKTNVYWREFYGDEQEFGVKNSREGFIKRMKDYDSKISRGLEKIEADIETAED